MTDSLETGLGDKLSGGQQYPVQEEKVENPVQAEDAAVQEAETSSLDISNQANSPYDPTSTEFRIYNEALYCFSKTKVKKAATQAVITFSASIRWSGDTFPCTFDGKALLKRVKADAIATEQQNQADRDFKKDEKIRATSKSEIVQQKEQLWSTLRERFASLLKNR